MTYPEAVRGRVAPVIASAHSQRQILIRIPEERNMKVLVVGATGLLGSKVGAVLRPTYDVIEAALDKAPEQVDIS